MVSRLWRGKRRENASRPVPTQCVCTRRPRGRWAVSHHCGVRGRAPRPGAGERRSPLPALLAPLLEAEPRLAGASPGRRLQAKPVIIQRKTTQTCSPGPGASPPPPPHNTSPLGLY